VDRCALFVDASYALADGAMAVHGTRRRDSVSWDHAGLLKLLAGLARDRTGLPVLRCYWYETASEGRRTAEHDALAEMPGLKLRLVNALPGRREGIESQLRRDLVTLANSHAITDAFIASANEHIAEIVAEVQDLGLRVVILHIASDGGWTIPVPLRQECDDIVEISGVHLRSYVDLIKGAEPVSADEQYKAGQSGALTHQGLPAAALPGAAVYQVQDAGYRQHSGGYGGPGLGEAQASASYPAEQATGSAAAQAPAGQKHPGVLPQATSAAMPSGSASAPGPGLPPYPASASYEGSMVRPNDMYGDYQGNSSYQQAAPNGSASGSQGLAASGQLDGGRGQVGSGQLDGGRGQVGSGQLDGMSQGMAQPGAYPPADQRYLGQPAAATGYAGGQPSGYPSTAPSGYQNGSSGTYQNAAMPNGSTAAQVGGADIRAGQTGAGQNAAAQNMGPQNMGAQNVSAQNVSAQNVSAQNVSAQNVSAQNATDHGNLASSGPGRSGSDQNGLAANIDRLHGPSQSGAVQGAPAQAGGIQAGAGLNGGTGYQSGQNGAGQLGYPGQPGHGANGAAQVQPGAYPAYQRAPSQSPAPGSGPNGSAMPSQPAPGQLGRPQNGAGPGYQAPQGSAVQGSSVHSVFQPVAPQADPRARDPYGPGLASQQLPGAPDPASAAQGQYAFAAPEVNYVPSPPGSPGPDQSQRAAFGQNPAGQNTPGQYPAGQNTPGQYPAGQNTPGQYPAGQNTPGQYPAGQNTPGQYPAGQNTPGQYPAGQNTPGQYPAGQYSAGTGVNQQYQMPQQAAAPLPAVRAQQPVAISLPDAVKAAHAEGFTFGQSVGREAPGLWLEAVLARKPRMPSDLEARLLQGSVLPIDSLLHDEVRHSLRRGFWDALESARR
jgi:hypothetical protein